MWLITPIGFFSIVQKPSDLNTGTLTLRARVKSDLVRLKQHYLPSLSAIRESHDSDYRFRASASKAEVAQVMVRLVQDIHYDNFKSEVYKEQGQERANLYHQVWSVMHQLQTQPALQDPPAVTSAGAVLVQNGRFLLRKPSQHFGGYHWTFAKTAQKTAEPLAKTALRALREKTGYSAIELQPLQGSFQTLYSDTQYFLFNAPSQIGQPNAQTSSLRWATYEEARQLLSESTNIEGRERDLTILKAAQQLLSESTNIEGREQDLAILKAAQAETDSTQLSRFRGCLLGGAVGDALGAPVEFLDRASILKRFGPDGIGDYAPAYGGLGRITDDTQMTLFTAEGLLRGWVRDCLKGITSYLGVTAHAYLRWLMTQGMTPKKNNPMFGMDEPGWLFGLPELHSRRAPGNTCLSALQHMASLGVAASNDSKGCGGVMRVAPVGLFSWRMGQTPEICFELATELAALTHGHPTGSLTAGVLAVLVQKLLDGQSLNDALRCAKQILRSHANHQESLEALEQAEQLATSAIAPEQAIAQLGEGWVAEEALAIAVYCALVAKDFQHGLRLAVNHSGDSDSTGSILGNLLGARDGDSVIPDRWLQPLELRTAIAEIAEDLYRFREWPLSTDSSSPAIDAIWRKYPGF